MGVLRSKCKVVALVVLFVWVAFLGLYELLKPAPNGCIMTYMYPTYIPVSTPANVSSDKYGLFLYHEGWKQIDFDDHLKKINGVPVLFIPGNGGSYKQVRSLAAESARAYQGGPLEQTFYQEAYEVPEKTGNDLLLENLENFALPNQYNYKLDWFAVDLEGEHSAMDGRILQEHTEYVVYAIHRILDQYRESREALSKEGADVSGSLPSSVILVGHSMGGFVARAAIVHPHLRKSVVETIITLSSPHQSPPIALQPSLGHYFSQVNAKWRKGYEIQTNNAGHIISGPKLSHVVIISIAGGIYDYQVRSKLASLDGIVPSTNGFTIGSSGMKNVWLSMEHQSILWCNQLVVQVSHALLSIINTETGQPYPSVAQRILVLTKMLQSGIPHSLNIQPSGAQMMFPIKDVAHTAEPLVQGQYSCPPSAHWSDDGLEKDLYIESTTVTVLAMDGKRRWLDIKKLGSNGKGHFIFVTNLAPCSGVRLHLWPEKTKKTPGGELPVSKRILEVTSKMVHIPAGPAPRQIEPGSQTEQAPPSAFLQLSPEELHGFRFLTISVAPRPSVSGRPPPAASMAVGQFFNPKEGERKLSATTLVRSSYIQEEILFMEDHPLAFNLSFSVSLGLLPVTFSLKTTGCGLKTTGEQSGDTEQSRFCKLRCFPPVALAWDSLSGLHVIPNMYTETITVDSSPAMFDSSPESEKTNVLLLVDPHCSYAMGISVSLTSAASRFCLSYSSQIIGFMIAAVLFALMQQTRAWELDSSLPSILSVMEFNLRMPLPFLQFIVLPVFLSLPYLLLTRQQLPPIINYIFVSILCYLVANGAVMILILSSLLVLYASATIHVYIRKSWLAWEDNFQIAFFHQIFRFTSIFYSMKIMQILRGSPNFVVAFTAIPLVCFVHPALGLIVLLLSHALRCHSGLCSFLTASLRSHAQRKETIDSRTNCKPLLLSKCVVNDGFDPLLPVDESYSTSPNSSKSFSDSQLEFFNYQHSILILHLLATLMFLPSLVAWLQRIGMGQTFPWLFDSFLCTGVILHGLCGSIPDVNSISLSLLGHEAGLSLVYLLAGYFTFWNALASAPYRAFYAMAAIGAISCVMKIIDRRNRERGDVHSRSRRRHSHKH
ncbi:GPI inositol-deacylase isoform X1 [Canna indica]|uniref:GPI inositol-deacylase n=1 Tax=Canna indica TaxID=4628 RepID=A0AAQ3JSL0_9LILI|nr:GPI inositol-deacylase isoform X1 [Canna indica]